MCTLELPEMGTPSLCLSFYPPSLPLLLPPLFFLHLSFLPTLFSHPLTLHSSTPPSPLPPLPPLPDTSSGRLTPLSRGWLSSRGRFMSWRASSSPVTVTRHLTPAVRVGCWCEGGGAGVRVGCWCEGGGAGVRVGVLV